MNEDAIIRYLTGAFAGIEPFSSNGTTYFFYDPQRKFPLATLVTNDDHDQFSNLGRPSVFRLNIGISKATFRSLFGSSGSGDDYDFTALDRLMPHPVYGRMYWVCILNPGLTTFEQTIQPLLAEAYDMAVCKYSKDGGD